MMRMKEVRHFCATGELRAPTCRQRHGQRV